jgi:DNA (cytosine-5)-methyltransferase 1
VTSSSSGIPRTLEFSKKENDEGKTKKAFAALTDRPLLIDLFCKAGGAGMGYHRAGFDVLGIDIEPQPRYPFRFEQADALDWLREEAKLAPSLRAAAYHASPPCQADLAGLSAVNRKLGRIYAHRSLLAETRDLLCAFDRPYVIEQPQMGAQLINPVRLCGSSFRLPIRRHRQFESNVTLSVPPCDHGWQTEKKYWTSYRRGDNARRSAVVQVYGSGGEKQHWGPALGIDWMTYDELTQAIPPAYTEHLGRQLLAHLASQAAA